MAEYFQSEQPTAVEVQLRWGDMDPLNHVNNVQFARILEEARVRSMADWFGGQPRAFGFLIARQEIEFVVPLLYTTEPARVEIWASRIGGKSFDYGYRLRAADGTVSALAETTCATVDVATGQVVEIPADLREHLAAHTGPEVEFRRRR